MREFFIPDDGWHDGIGDDARGGRGRVADNTPSMAKDYGQS
ncbi:MAG TPA: hypothetical protein VIO81_07610 [Methyloversatilis sp.]